MTAFLRMPEVSQRVGLARSTLWLYVSLGKFPRPVPLCTGCCWLGRIRGRAVVSGSHPGFPPARSHGGLTMANEPRFPALAAWQRRWRDDPATHTRQDLLWRLACLERQAQEMDDLGFHETAEAVLRQARIVAAEAPAA